MRTVAIVGAGPGGLVAARTFLQHPKSVFDVAVFEKSDHLGGLWNLPAGSLGSHGFLHPQTPTNLSKFTVSFSDLSWDSIALDAQQSNNDQKHEYSQVPMFPPAWMAGRYLETYAQKYNLKDKIKFNCEVTQTERFRSGDLYKWRLSTRAHNSSDSHTSESTFVFDHLIIATGFFSHPRSTSPSLSPPDPPPNLKILHSSQYRTLDDLIPPSTPVKPNDRILVIGGGNSAGEIAGTISQHLSSALHSPTSRRAELTDVKITHITPRPLYALPPFVPGPNRRPGFVPLDLRLYDLDARPGQIQSYAGQAPDEVIPMVHSLLRNMIGSDQSDLGAPALVTDLIAIRRSGAAYVALSESYAEFVRSGLIDVVAGRVTALRTADDRLVAAFDDANGREQTHENVVAVVHASGYTPVAALSLLPPDVLAELEYDPLALRLPLMLDTLQSMNSSVPDLAFVGFYEGPYWGVMEMQARLVAETWACAVEGGEFVREQKAYEGKDVLRGLRKGMGMRAYNVPQYWLSDYLGYMEDAANDLGLERNHGRFEEHVGPISAARYVSSESSIAESTRTMEELERTVRASKEGAFVPRATFRALQGRWTLNRKITSNGDNLPSGQFVGEATFSPRAPTHEGVEDSSFDGEHLYAETGTFTPDAGGTMTASRHYVYRYREVEDTLSVWFVKPSDLFTVDYLYHSVVFKNVEVTDPGTAGQTATAEAEHLCDKDLYSTEYTFVFRGVALDQWTTVHRVKGPAKDYVSESVYTR